jgi:hypothetical protein
MSRKAAGAVMLPRLRDSRATVGHEAVSSPAKRRRNQSGWRDANSATGLG